MTDPSVLSRDALDGVKVALSVSASADLERLGLSETHCRLVVAELARAIVLAGGTLLYGGHLEKSGYTPILLNEAQRFQGKNEAFRIYLAEPIYRQHSVDDLSEVDQRLGVSGALRLVSGDGSETTIAQSQSGSQVASDAEAFTAMREMVANEADARVIVGGQLAGYRGSEPGLIEEARLSAAKGTPLFVAAGYGGAALAIARKLSRGEVDEWTPNDLPLHGQDVAVIEALDRLAGASTDKPVPDGLNDDERRVLVSTHRPGDIATLVVRGLAKVNES